VGMPGRALEGKFLENAKLGLTRPKSCPYNCLHTCDYKVVPYCIILALYNAYKGKMDKGYAFAGSNAYLSARISTVKEVIHSMISEFNKREADVMAGSNV
ncbi:MAG TPA: nitronate monooxygenase, partial [Paludibacteraceae bacterium]|nr:nitronate monooxygenase [Paludibacteraceae bacterium]